MIRIGMLIIGIELIHMLTACMLHGNQTHISCNLTTNNTFAKENSTKSLNRSYNSNKDEDEITEVNNDAPTTNQNLNSVENHSPVFNKNKRKLNNLDKKRISSKSIYPVSLRSKSNKRQRINGSNRKNKIRKNQNRNDDQSLEFYESTFDAVANIRGELYFFKDDQFWRITYETKYDSAKIKSFWMDFPDIKINAVFSFDANIYFFTGKWVYIYKDTQISEKPSPITYFGLPRRLDKVDAAYVVYDCAYFFRKNQYWKFDLKNSQLKKTYPRSISKLKNVPSSVDAAVQNPFDGEIYFIKGHLWWQLNKDKLEVEKGFPQNISTWWKKRENEIKQYKGLENEDQYIYSITTETSSFDSNLSPHNSASIGAAFIKKALLIWLVTFLTTIL